MRLGFGVKAAHAPSSFWGKEVLFRVSPGNGPKASSFLIAMGLGTEHLWVLTLEGGGSGFERKST
jgi:hypothetical protein